MPFEVDVKKEQRKAVRYYLTTARKKAKLVRQNIELVGKYQPVAVVIDPKGSASTLIAELERAGIPLTQVTWPEYSRACGSLHDLVDQGTFWHVDQPILNAAVAGATAKVMPSGGWKWAPRGEVSVGPLRALTLALHGHTDAGSNDITHQIR